MANIDKNIDNNETEEKKRKNLDKKCQGKSKKTFMVGEAVFVLLF